MSDEIKLKASFNFNTLLFFFFIIFLFFTKKKTKKKTIEAKHYGGESLRHYRPKIQEAAIISSNISAQKEGIVPKTTHFDPLWFEVKRSFS